MFYESDLRFLESILQKCHLQILTIDPAIAPTQNLDLGLRETFGFADEYDRILRTIEDQIQPNTIYRLTDRFAMIYLYLRLPQTDLLLQIGPYMGVELQHEDFLELAEKNGIAAQFVRDFSSFYTNIPLFINETILIASCQAFAERIWGGYDQFTMIDVNREMFDSSVLTPSKDRVMLPESTARNMKIMEMRYAYENELMEAVSMGLSQKTELLLSAFSMVSFEQRLPDQLRNLKNYCIITNTLLRKAAESGGVHPIYLDSISSNYARRIEALPSVNAGRELMSEMFRAYCRLVKKHSTKDYSPLVQKAIIHIDSDLGSDLSLKTLAQLQNVNASYLSTLFKRETGQTVTEFVHNRRVELAIRLLSTTKLQIQTIASHCGFLDIQYFTKVFKKITGKTPKEYRSMLH